MKKMMLVSLFFLVACALAATPLPVPSRTMNPMPDELIDEKGVSMRLVPAGEFTMGSEDGEEDERPVHQVYLDAFYMDVYEVTNASFAACVKDGGCYAPQNTSSHTRPDYYGNPEFDQYPVIYMSGYKAEEYCTWRGARLPTEAEWEKAARGVNGFTYPWGNTMDGTKLNSCDKNCPFSWSDQTMDDGYEDTAPVGSYESGRSPYGMYDMAGNVWEWVADGYDAAYYQTSPLSNPLGPELGDHRALRGGSWSDTMDFTRATTRKSYFYYYYPDTIYSRFGFRCARDTAP
jgi:formylglycine-generating enzyme required for sulfatase activity